MEFPQDKYTGLLHSLASFIVKRFFAAGANERFNILILIVPRGLDPKNLNRGLDTRNLHRVLDTRNHRHLGSVFDFGAERLRSPYLLRVRLILESRPFCLWFPVVDVGAVVVPLVVVVVVVRVSGSESIAPLAQSHVAV